MDSLLIVLGVLAALVLVAAIAYRVGSARAQSGLVVRPAQPFKLGTGERVREVVITRRTSYSDGRFEFEGCAVADLERRNRLSERP